MGHQGLNRGQSDLQSDALPLSCAPAPCYVMPWRYKVQNDVENPSSKRKRMDNTRRLNDLVFYKINCHILLRRGYFLYNKEKEGIKQKKFIKTLFSPVIVKANKTREIQI